MRPTTTTTISMVHDDPPQSTPYLKVFTVIMVPASCRRHRTLPYRTSQPANGALPPTPRNTTTLTTVRQHGSLPLPSPTDVAGNIAASLLISCRSPTLHEWMARYRVDRTNTPLHSNSALRSYFISGAPFPVVSCYASTVLHRRTTD